MLFIFFSYYAISPELLSKYNTTPHATSKRRVSAPCPGETHEAGFQIYSFIANSVKVIIRVLVEWTHMNETGVIYLYVELWKCE